MTFNEAIQKAKENKIPHNWQEEIIESNCLTPKALEDFKKDFIFMVENLVGSNDLTLIVEKV